MKRRDKLKKTFEHCRDKLELLRMRDFESRPVTFYRDYAISVRRYVTARTKWRKYRGWQ